VTFASSAFANSAFQTDTAAAGNSGGHRHRHKTLHLPRRTVLEIGGEQFVIGNEADALEVLVQARALAPQTAQVAAEKALRKRHRVRSGLAPIMPVPPQVRVLHAEPEIDTQALWAQIDAANTAFNTIYAQAWRQAMENDDDEAILLTL